MASRPTILMLVNKRNWAYDFTARSLAARLRERFRIIVRSVRERPNLARDRFDLLYVLWWADRWHHQFGVPRERVIRHVSSHRWQLDPKFGPLSAAEFAAAYLSDCRLVTTPSLRLQQALSAAVPDAFLCPVGFEPKLFHPGRPPRGQMRIAWIGNPKDPCKRLDELLIPACRGRYDLTTSSGRWTRNRVARVYRAFDVVAIASNAEGEPLPLIEGLASGCFPVTTDVGIAPELIDSGRMGLIVEPSISAFQRAFQWCQENLDELRASRAERVQRTLADRCWDMRSERFSELFEYALRSLDDPRAKRPAARALPRPARSAHRHSHPSHWPLRDWAAEVDEFIRRYLRPRLVSG